MAQVSVGQVENLKDAVADIALANESLAEDCRILTAMVAEKTMAAETEEADSLSRLDTAREAEAMAIRTLEQARCRHTEAASYLATAEADLSACERQLDDKDGNLPDCSGEESAVSAARAECQIAESELSQANEVYDEAKTIRIALEGRLDLARRALSIARGLGESVAAGIGSRMQIVQQLTDTGRLRLLQAASALDAYLATNPFAADFAAWVRWSPSSSVPVTPKELNERLSLSPRTQGHLLAYLSDRDPTFRAKIENYRRDLGVSQGAAERHAVQLRLRRNLSGEVAERLTAEALRPLGGSIRTQVRKDVAGGRTYTDLILENVNVPVILGRGQGVFARPGDSIAIEVKCGRADYLYAQKDHMVFQSGGHSDAAASMTVCSRNIKDLAEAQEEALRNALRESGSPLMGMLPRKEEIDKACWDAISANEPQKGGET